MIPQRIAVAGVSILALLLTACGPGPAITVTGNALPEMSEGDTGAMTCEANDSFPGGIASVDINLVEGTGLLRADRNPAAAVAEQDYAPRSTGKSRTARFNCVAVANNGDRNSIPLSTIVRDALAPAWVGAAPAVPANGSDGAAAGKVGVSFDITVAAEDLAPGAGIGVASGIYQIEWTLPANITINNAVHTTSGRPKGPPDANAGPPDISQTFTLTCTAAGASTVNVKVTDTAENSVNLDLGVECYVG